MSYRLLSIFGIFVSVSCFWVATRLHPGGYDWSRDYLSILLRDPSNPARLFAVCGMLFFCVSIASVFERLVRTVEFSKNAKIIRIGSIGSMIYASLAFTPMHDLMVTISVIFFFLAVLPLTQSLYINRERGFFAAGCGCLAVLIVSVTIYYTGRWVAILPWAQRAVFTLFALWLVSLDCSFPRLRLQTGENGQS